MIFGSKRVNCDEMDGDRLRLPANRNCYRLSRVSWALLKFLVSDVTVRSVLLCIISQNSTNDYNYFYTFHHSVVCPSVTWLSVTFMPLLELLDVFRCHLVGTLVGSSDRHIVLDEVPDAQRVGKFGGQTPKPKKQLRLTCEKVIMVYHMVVSVSDFGLYRITLVLVFLMIWLTNMIEGF